MKAVLTTSEQDINNIEGVQRRMTKMMREVEEKEYEQRMKKAKLLSLEIVYEGHTIMP